jgi:oligopeptide/dipeptide ABC transporter ATP-binding protein
VMTRFPHQLSGGMRQRVMIAIALSCNPSLLIADEPTTALDVTIQAQILTLMRNLKKDSNTSIMIITHDLGVVAEIADRVIVMYAGEVVEEAPVYELFENPLHPYTQGLMASIPKVHDVVDDLYSIEGTVPNPSDMPAGCKFHPRCPLASSECTKIRPELKQMNELHAVRCIKV